jgi:hypothetical protein
MFQVQCHRPDKKIVILEPEIRVNQLCDALCRIQLIIGELVLQSRGVLLDLLVVI